VIKQSNASRRLLIMGHRGARYVVPENTQAAYELAMEVGVDCIELDVHLSKDDALIVMHDATLDRTTDGVGEIRDWTLAELRALNAAATYEGERDYGVQRIPTLQDVYDLVQGRIQINIEIKTDSRGKRYPGMEEKLIEVIERNQAADYTIISSFDFPTLECARSLAPALGIYGIVSKEYFQKIDVDDPARVVEGFIRQGFHWVAVNKAFLTKELAHDLTSAGITVHTWVINDVAEMWSFVDMGIDVITTDRPDLLVAAYREAKLV
jgi:glycerophosphoryl diester phosphodiesterase